MPTTVISSIGAGKDYSTLSAWWTAKNKNLVTADEIQVAEVYGTTNGYCFLTGATTDSTHYYVIRAASGQNFKGNFGSLTGQAVCSYTSLGGSYPYVIHNAQEYTRIEGLVFTKNTTATTTVSPSLIFNNANNLFVKNCGLYNLFHSSSSNSVTVGINSNGFTCFADNCFVDNIKSHSTNTSKATNAYGMKNVTARNCTVTNIVGSGHPTLSTGAGFNDCHTTNCMALNCTGTGTYSWCFLNVVGGSNYCVADDATAPGANSYNNVTNTTQITTLTAGSANCNLQSISDCVDNATNLSAYFIDDIRGYTRTGTWDIGASEYGAIPPVVAGVKWNGLTISKFNGVAVSKINGIA